MLTTSVNQEFPRSTEGLIYLHYMGAQLGGLEGWGDSGLWTGIAWKCLYLRLQQLMRAVPGTQLEHQVTFSEAWASSQRRGPVS